MCVALIAHKPILLQDHEAMEQDNPHGAGVAWAADGKLHFRRGLKAKEIWEMQENGDLTYPYACHYRWATHGEQVPELTHPFPLGPRAFFGELQGTAPKLMIHNGVWNECTEWASLVPDTITAAQVSEASDTAIAAYFAEEFPDIADLMPWAVAMLSLDADGNMAVSKHGRTWLEHEGNEYSNLSWLSTQTWVRKYMARGWHSEQPSRAWSWTDDDAGPVYRRSPMSTSEIKLEAREDIGGAGPDWEDWGDYVRARYGDEVADAVKRDEISATALDELEALEDDMPSDLQEWPEELNFDLPEVKRFDPDLVSESPGEVNAWLANWKVERSKVA